MLILSEPVIRFDVAAIHTHGYDVDWWRRSSTTRGRPPSH